MWVTLAAETSDVIGYGTAGGSLALLGWVIRWLLTTHIPRLQSDAKDQLVEVTKAFREDGEKSEAAFKAALDVVVNHCKDESVRLMEAFRTEISRVARGAGGKQ